jgi:hypothetical protein
MLDPTRQAALKKSMGYFDKWADTYKGPTYKGPLTAGRTSDWYTAQNMAHKMANRFSEGGITSVRRFDDGGQTFTLDSSANEAMPFTLGPSANEAQTFTLGPSTDNTNVNTANTGVNTAQADSSAPAPATTFTLAPQTTVDYSNIPSNLATPITDDWGAEQKRLAALQESFTSKGQMDSWYAAHPQDMPGGVESLTYAGIQAAKEAADQAVKDAALQKAITDANLTPANVTPTVTSTNMGSPYLLGQALTLGGAGSAFRLGSDVSPKQIFNSYNTPDKFTPATWDKTAMDTYMSPYTQGVVDIALREAERQRGIERLRENTAATQSGAFGGYRQGVVEAEGERNYNQSRNDITTKGYQNAYTDAVSQFAADRAAKQAAYTGNQQALQAAATGDISAGQYNQANKFQAFTNQLNALNQGVSNVQNLGALETAYQNGRGNAGAALTSMDASARADQQAQYDALMKVLNEIGNVDLTKFQALVAGAGVGSGNNSGTQVKTSGSVT